MDSSEDILEERPLPGKDRQSIVDAVSELIVENNNIVPANSTCTLPNSEFKIDLVEGAELWFKRQYDIPEKLRPIVRRRMKEWWDAGWVQPFEDGKNIYNTAWLAVAKVSGGRVAPDDARVCMDYRPGNGKSKDPEYFIPRVKDLLTKVWGMEVFTELDLANAYHQIKLHPDSRKYSGFYFPGEGQFIWNVLFFGVKGAVTHFQRVMEEALSDVPSHIVVVIYVDNILVASKEVKMHKDDVEAVIKALNKANLHLKPSKCKIAMEAIQFMGIIVDGRRRGVDAFKAKAFQETLYHTSYPNNFWDKNVF